MMADWDVVSTAPASEASKSDEWSVIGKGSWQPNPEALKPYQGKSNVSVVFMSPDKYLSLTPPLDKNAKADAKGQALKDSLSSGAKIEDIPTLDLNVGKDGAKVIDQDGRNRATYAKEQGVDLIPVAITKWGRGEIKDIEGMTGTKVPYDFKPLPGFEQKPGDYAPPMDKADRFGAGVLDPAAGLTQLAAHAGMPGLDPQVVDKNIQAREQQITAGRRGDVGLDPYRVAGNVASPLNYLAAAGKAAPLARAALGGAASGAMQPVTDGKDYATEKAKDVGIGAALGGTIGVAGEVASRLIPKAVITPIANFVQSMKGVDVAKNTAAQKILDRMASDVAGGGPKAQDMIDLLHLTPDKPQTLADVGGENLKALMGRISRQPGEAREIISGFLNGRDVDAGLRLTGDVNKALTQGSGTGVYKTAEALMQGRSAAAGPLYDAAYAANKQVESPILSRVLETPAGKKALSQAAVKMQNDMTLLGKPDPELTEAAREAVERGTMDPHGSGVGVARGLKLRTWDYIKRSLDDQIGAAQRGGEKDDARILTGLKQGLVNELDKLDTTGNYAKARAAYSGPSQSLEALENGTKVLKGDPEEISAQFAKLSPSDKEFYRLGAAASLRQAIAKTGAAGDEARAIIGNSYKQSQLRPLFETEGAFNKFIDSVKAESRMFRTRYDVLGNSRTAARAMEDEHGGMDTMIHGAKAVGHATTGNYLAALSNAARAVGDRLHRIDPEVSAHIARTLTSTGAQGSAGMNLLRNFSMIAPATRNHLGQFIQSTYPALAPGVSAGVNMLANQGQ